MLRRDSVTWYARKLSREEIDDTSRDRRRHVRKEITGRPVGIMGEVQGVEYIAIRSCSAWKSAPCHLLHGRAPHSRLNKLV